MSFGTCYTISFKFISCFLFWLFISFIIHIFLFFLLLTFRFFIFSFWPYIFTKISFHIHISSWRIITHIILSICWKCLTNMGSSSPNNLSKVSCIHTETWGIVIIIFYFIIPCFDTVCSKTSIRTPINVLTHVSTTICFIEVMFHLTHVLTLVCAFLSKFFTLIGIFKSNSSMLLTVFVMSC